VESTAKRLLIGLVVLAFLGTSAVLLWRMAYRPAPRPDRVTVDSLTSAVSIDWSNGGGVQIATDDSLDLVTALGYAHGMERPWVAALRRQTALGRLGRWFGSGVLPIDRHVRQLGLARQAQAVYTQLPPAQQRLLSAYTRGLNAALTTERVRSRDAFVLLGVSPEAWAPWHPLAVERLLAWLSTPLLDPPETADAPLPAALTSFLQRDRLLRRWLHAHGFERSVAWTVRGAGSDTTRLPPPSNADPPAPATSSSPSSRRTLFQRHVTGASALPFFQEVVWLTPDGSPTTLATVPGTLLAPAGTAGRGRAWSILLGSERRLRRTPVDTTQIEDHFERITLRSGAETIEAVPRTSASGLPFPAPPDTSLLAHVDTSIVDSLFVDSLRIARNAPSADRDSLVTAFLRADPRAADSLLLPPHPVDSTWVVEWPGLRAETDLGTWLRLAGLSSPPDAENSAAADTKPLLDSGDEFRLFDGVGLVVEASGASRILGQPPVVEPLPNGVLIGRTRWVRFQAEALRERLQSPQPIRPAVWSASDSSLWAARALPVFSSALPTPDSTQPRVRDAVTYLRNWNHVYDRASIGATLFDQWMRAYRKEIGRLPTADDSTYFAGYFRRRALVRAVDSLEASQGQDLRQWRWERVAPDRRYFPVFSADSLIEQSVASVARTRFAPLDRPGRGHPSALSGGPALVDPVRLGPSPSAWEAWTDPRRRRLTVRRLQFDPAEFLARPLTEGQRSAPVTPAQLPASNRTVLTPEPEAN